METTIFNGGGSPFCSSLLSLFLGVLLDPNSEVLIKHPLCSPDVIVPENFAELSEKEKDAFLDANLNDYWKRYLDKISNPDEEDLSKLETSLNEINTKIKALSDERQAIIDKWVMQ